MKRRGLFFIIGIMIIAGAATYFSSYCISLSQVTLVQDITNWQNRGRKTEESPNIEIYGGVDLGELEYYVLSQDDQLGVVTLKEGLFHRYKIESLSLGNRFLQGIVESGGKQYFVLAGQDIAQQIARVKAEIGGQVYEMELPKPAHYFIVHVALETRVEEKNILPHQFTLYNLEGEEITENYDRSSGGIS